MEIFLQSNVPFRIGVIVCLGLAIFSASAGATPWPGARVTRVINSVRLQAEEKQPATAVAEENVIPEKAALQTAGDARVELRLDEKSLTRLGTGTIFSFERQGRELQLRSGSAFVQISKKAHTTTIFSAGMAANVTGTTAVFESYPAVYKFFVLEGTARLYRPGHLGDSILVKPGRMVIGKPNTPLSDPVDFDIERFVKTSRFITDFTELSSAPRIAAAVMKQRKLKSKKTLIDTNLVIFGGGTAVSLVNPDQPVQAGGSSAGTAPPPPADLARPVNSTVADKRGPLQRP